MENLHTNSSSAETATSSWVRNAAGEWVKNTVDTAKQTEKNGADLGEWVQTGNGWQRAGRSTTEVASVNPEYEKTQYDINREILASSEGGVLLVAAYDAAVKMEPRLNEVKMVPYTASTRGSRGSAFARAADMTESGKHEVHIRVGELDNSLDLMQDTLDQVPGLRELISERLLLDPAELTPMQLHTFVMLHELGHTVEFMNNEGNLAELRDRQHREKEALPLGNIATSALIDPSSPGGQYVRENWSTIRAAYGVGDIAELAKLKNTAHRSMTSEKFADDFATDVLVYEPTLLEQLGSDNLDYYRGLQAA